MQSTKTRYSRREVSQHSTKEDCWISIHGEVYNVTSWLSKHPGGTKILLNHAGEDASVVWTTFHADKKLVSKYMTAYHIGSLIDEEKEHPVIIRDFLKLRKNLEDEGMFKANTLFDILMYVQALSFEAVAWCILYYFGNTWTTFLLSGVLFGISQMQLHWQVHDHSHTPFRNKKLGWFLGRLNHGLFKGFPVDWLDGRHNLHHSKTNVLDKDPEITMPFDFFLLGESRPKKWGANHWGILPYQFQHIYILFTMPNFALTFFFQSLFLIHVWRDSRWVDLLWFFSFFVRLYLMYMPLFGSVWTLVGWYFLMRLVESHWFVWVTQSSHVSMDVDYETNIDWVSMQLKGTCNQKSSLFVDWFAGHSNFQIEHHLFPTMPRANYKIVQPRVKEFCHQHGLAYEDKNFFIAISDIFRTLKRSGQVWVDAWRSSDKMD